jgi:ABC-type nitrate/sulfonate/bicarbonate transport system substrate-binding protein
VTRGPAVTAAVLLAIACGRQPVRDESRLIRVAGGETPNFSDLATLVAQRRLADRGYVIELLGFAQAELAVEVVARGAADVSFGSIPVYWAAAMRGAPVVTVMEQSRTRHVIMARLPIRACADFHGRTIAVNSLGATGGNLFKAYVAEECPGTEAQILVMPRPQNRAAALLAGGIDGAVLLREDSIRLTSRSKGIAPVEDLADRWPTLATNGMFVNRDYARRRPEVVDEFIRVQLDVMSEIGADPARIAEAARRELADEKDLPAIAEAFARARAWDPTGGLSPSAVADTIRFLTDTGSITGSIDAALVVDRSFLDRARRPID